jgi:RNA-splicing ligase RtcB
MGDDAVIVEGVDSEAARAPLYSTIHGAGRLFGRKEAKRRFTRVEMDQWLQSRGVTLIGADLDENPMAYCWRSSRTMPAAWKGPRWSTATSSSAWRAYG